MILALSEAATSNPFQNNEKRTPKGPFSLMMALAYSAGTACSSIPRGCEILFSISFGQT